MNEQVSSTHKLKYYTAIKKNELDSYWLGEMSMMQD